MKLQLPIHMWGISRAPCYYIISCPSRPASPWHPEQFVVLLWLFLPFRASSYLWMPLSSSIAENFSFKTYCIYNPRKTSVSAPKLNSDALFICSHGQLSHCTLTANHLSKLLPCCTLPDGRNHVLIDVISSPLTQFTMLKSLGQCLA